jgi:hypothetical protein
MKRLTLIATLVALALPGVAQAGTGSSAARSAGQLPFTSSDLVLLVGGAIVLILAGSLARYLTTLSVTRSRASAPAPGTERQTPAGLAQPAGSR